MQTVKLVVLDVDGTLTDGVIVFHDDGTQSKAFHVADGLGIVMAQAAGLRIAVISSRRSPAVAARLSELKVGDVHLDVNDKAGVLRSMMTGYGLEPHEVACVGDDLNDLPMFALAGVRIAVADAAEAVRARADWVTPRPGGRGAVRDALEEILRRQGRLDDAMTTYLSHLSRSEAGPAQ